MKVAVLVGCVLATSGCGRIAFEPASGADRAVDARGQDPADAADAEAAYRSTAVRFDSNANDYIWTGSLQNTADSLKPQGRIGVVDFTPGGGGPGPAPEERVDPNAIIASASAAGLTLLGRESVPPFQYMLVFGRSPQAGKNQPGSTP